MYGVQMSSMIGRLTMAACCGKLCSDVTAWCDQYMTEHLGERCVQGQCKQRAISKKDIQPLILHQPSIADLDLSAISNGETMEISGTYHGTATGEQKAAYRHNLKGRRG